MEKNPYAGKIKNQGTQVVQGPYAGNKSGGNTVKHTGGDLRSGKKK